MSKTINYKEKYEKALKAIKELLDKGDREGLTIVSYRKEFEEIFSELAESDERIRKALIDYFNNANKADENPLQIYGIHTDKVIAWLEKIKR